MGGGGRGGIDHALALRLAGVVAEGGAAAFSLPGTCPRPKLRVPGSVHRDTHRSPFGNWCTSDQEPSGVVTRVRTDPSPEAQDSVVAIRVSDFAR